VIYLYGVCHGSSLPAMRDELERRGLGSVRFGELAAIFGDVAGEVALVSEERLWEHEDVVEALMGAGALLPARYGMVIADEAALEEALEARATELAAALRAVGGKVELAVRARFSAGIDGGPQRDGEGPQEGEGEGGGTAYMSALMQRRRLAEDLAGRIDARLAGLASASTKRTLPSATQPMAGAYLVERDAVAGFRAQVQALDEEMAEAEVVCTGPWPPYSFTGAGGGAGDES
jgi:hypothetical protein